MGAAQHGTHDIGGAQTNEGRGETGTDGGSGHLEGNENDHKAEHKAAGTDSAKSMRKDDDASHENVARTRMGDGEGSDEQSDAFRSQAPKGAGDETGAAWRSETALITVFGKHCDCNAQKCTHLKRLAPLASHLLLLSHCVLTQHEGQRKKSNYID